MTKVGRRAAVVCTSGTAVANLHPAVLEAAHAGVPLVVRHRRPARAAARHRRQPDHRPGAASSATAGSRHRPRARRPAAQPRRGHRVGRRRLAPPVRPGPSQRPPVHLNVQLDDPLVPGRDPGAAGRRRRPSRAARSGASRCPRRRCRSARAPWWSPATTPARRPGCWPSGRAGRCSPSRPAGRAPAPTRCAPTGCCSAARSADEIERVVVCGHPTLSRPVSRLLAPRRRRGRLGAAARSLGASGRSPVDRVRARGRRRRHRRPGLAGALAGGRRRGLPAARPLLAAEAGLTPYDVAGAVEPRPTPERAAGRRRLQPDPRPRPDGRAVRRRRAPQGDRQPRAWPASTAPSRPRSAPRSAAPARRPQPRADGRRDVPARRHRAGDRARRAAARPDDRGRQRRRRLDLRDARAGRRRSTPTRYDRLFGTPHGVDLASLCAATRTPHWRVDSTAPSSSRRWPARTAAIEVVEAVVRRDNRRELDERIRALGVPGAV